MIISKKIETLVKEENDLTISNIWNISKNIVDDTKNHINEITTQMSNYDIHDEKHSEKVMNIIAEILGDKIHEMSFYELLLIYLTAYLHDAAMALPKWEYDILKAVEGTEQCNDNTLNFKIYNDFKPVHKYVDAIKIVTENKRKLYGDFDVAKHYIFSESTEETLISNLAELLREYEEFRNGYVVELEKYKNSVTEYVNFSKIIRSEFIRNTHHIRIEKYIEGLKRKYIPYLGNLEADRLITTLKVICRSHGENIDFIFKQNTYIKISENKINIQFIAILLRIGDVVHFSSDRAPLSLFAEKRITDETSLKHWNAKFQELKYCIEVQGNYKYIKFSAYCTTPEIYYFIQDYVDWIDEEISNYFALKQKWEYDKIEDNERYNLSIGNKVDRTQIVSDRDVFIPESNLKFTLDQSKILELLTGIQLYKDKYLCLREVYQNALDASKCMIAYNQTRGISKILSITFGIGEELNNGIKQRYIYCLDHGIGMNQNIIKSFLLNIGNSYYKSRDFMKKNVGWNQVVKPTSQFGIGILSGYMIADKIGITTKYYENENSIVSFILVGANEHFYYISPNKIDEEKIGDHGTLVKLYLKSEYDSVINNNHISKMPLLLMSDNSNTISEFIDPNELSHNLMYLISKKIGIEHKNIPVFINDNNENSERLFSSCAVFDYRDYDSVTSEDVEKLWQKYHYLDGSSNPYKDVLKMRNYIIDYPIEITSENLEIYSHITFPTKDINEWNLNSFDFCHFIGNREGSIFVDGIYVNSDILLTDSINQLIGKDVVRKSIINFIGEKRPALSVDRNSIINMPEMKDEYDELRNKFVNTIIELICHHIEKYKIGLNDEQMSIILEIITRQFPTTIGKVIERLGNTEISGAIFPDNIFQEQNITIHGLIAVDCFKLDDIDFRNYKEITRQIILGKLINASKIGIENSILTVEGTDYIEFPFSKYNLESRDISLSSLVIKADIWDETYKEYDLVSRYWPIINPMLYNVINDEYEVHDIIKNRCKTISNSENGLYGIAKCDPVMINPKVGIAQKEEFVYKHKECYVGEFDRIAKNYWLFELNNHGQIERNDKKSNVLYAFISPRKLNTIEEQRLQEFEDSDPMYVQGIREGWSILFLGAIEKYVIYPGIMEKKDILSKIPNSFKELKPDIDYYFTDGTKVF